MVRHTALVKSDVAAVTGNRFVAVVMLLPARCARRLAGRCWRAPHGLAQVRRHCRDLRPPRKCVNHLLGREWGLHGPAHERRPRGGE